MIEREVYVGRTQLDYPINYVYGTDMIPIRISFMDYEIPFGTMATAYAVKPNSETVKKTLCVIDGNSIVFTPRATFFEPGTNIMQIRITKNGENLITFKQVVKCEASIVDDAAVDVETDPTIVTQILTELGVLEGRINNIINSGGNSSVEVSDARVGSDGTLYPSLKARLDGETSELKADFKENSDRITALENGGSVGGGSGVTSAFITALQELFSAVAVWDSDKISNPSAKIEALSAYASGSDSPIIPDQPSGQGVNVSWSGTTAKFSNLAGVNVSWSGTTARIGA